MELIAKFICLINSLLIHLQGQYSLTCSIRLCLLNLNSFSVRTGHRHHRRCHGARHKLLYLAGCEPLRAPVCLHMLV